MTTQEKSLYDDVTAYLLEPQLLAFRGKQRQLLLIGFRRLMASSVPALAGSLKKVAERLNGMLHGQGAGQDTDIAFLADLEDEDLQAESEADKFEPADPLAVEAELHRVRNFIARAEALPRDSKAGKLLDAMRVISERPPERRRVVIFTESLVTQAYLESLLIQSARQGVEDVSPNVSLNGSVH